MREGGLRRGQSPGYRSDSRSRSRSPRARGRQRSWSRSPGWDRRSRSRSPAGRYSRSPPHRYSRSRSRTPPRQRLSSPPPRSDSSDESGQITDRARRRHGQSAQQQQAGKRQDSSAEQVHVLQQQLEAEQVARTAAESKADLLRNKLREVAERSKARGNSLAALLSAVRRVADAKQELSAAEAELQQALQDAEAFLQDEGAAPQAQPHAVSAAAAAAAQPPPPPPPLAAAQQDQDRLHEGVMQQNALNGTDMHDADGQPEAGDGQAPGGWVQAVDERAAAPSSAKPAPLSNIKFSLKL